MNTSAEPTIPIASEVTSVTNLFHRVNSVIPDGQILITVEPEMPVADGLALLEKNGFSQVPVVVGREVLGLFSYQTFSRHVIKYSQEAIRQNRKLDPLTLTVEECMDPKPHFARVTDEFKTWFDVINCCDSILVGSPDRLQGIVTAMDILLYLYDVASPFVMLGEVELALRALMQMAVDIGTLEVCARQCLKDMYAQDKMPKLHEMTFNDYIQIIGDGRGWSHFEQVFGSSRVRTRAKLVQLRDVRNVIFHFRRKITLEEYETLAANRDWMLQKARAADARLREKQQ